MPAWFAVVAQWDAARALWEGRFEEARRLSRRTEELTPNDPSFHAASRDQRAVARIETGSGAHLIEGYKSLVTTFPSFAYARAALAYLRAEAGDVDAARRDFEGLAANSFAAMPYGISRPATLHRLAEACVSLGDSNHAAQLYEILLPYAGQLLIAFLLQACLAAADRDLGVLAATMGRLDDAERHLLAAEQLEDGFGAPPLAARTRLALARVLLQRAAPGDTDRARALLSSVVTATAAMGMAGVERAARELLQV
jgi:tetratricopeptide (TPR) repeat protein